MQFFTWREEILLAIWAFLSVASLHRRFLFALVLLLLLSSPSLQRKFKGVNEGTKIIVRERVFLNCIIQ